MENLKLRFHSLLKRSEKIFKTDMVYLASGGFWLGVGQVFSWGSGFLLTLALANLMSKESYGLYRLALSIMGILSIFTISGINDSLIRSIAKGFDGSLWPATWARIKGGAVGGVAALAVAAYYLAHANMPLAIACALIGAFMPFFEPFGNFGAYLQGKKDFRRLTLYGTCNQLFAVTVLVATVFLTHNFIFVLLAYLGSYTLVRLATYLWIIIKMRPAATKDPGVVRYGTHLSLMGIIVTVASQIDRIILFHFLGPADVASYSIAIAPPDQVKQGLNIMAKLIYPRFSGHSEAAIKSNISNKVILFGLAAAAGVGVYVVLAPYFFDIFFSQYRNVVFISQLFSLSMFNAVFGPVELFMEAHAKIKEQYWVNGITSTFQIVSMVVGTIYFGLIGLIVARMITRFVGGFTFLYFYYHPFKAKQADVMPATKVSELDAS